MYFALNDSFSSSAVIALSAPLPYQATCAQFTMTYMGSAQGLRPGRAYSQHVSSCYTYVPAEASKNALSGSTLIGIIIGCVAGFLILLLLLAVVLLRIRRAAKGKRESAEALQPRSAMEVNCWLLNCAGNILIIFLQCTLCYWRIANYFYSQCDDSDCLGP